MATRSFVRHFGTLTQVVGLCTLVLLALSGLFNAIGVAPVGAAPDVQPLMSVPQVFNFQGVARNADGDPLPNGEYSMTFRIYPEMTAQTTLWEETQDGIAVRDGRFSATLGIKTPVPPAVFTSPNAFIGVTVGNAAELAPRQRISSVPFAFNADALDGYDSTSFAARSHAHAASEIGNGLTDTQVNDNLTINGGSINNTVIGQNTPNTAKFTSVGVDSLTASGLLQSKGLTSSDVVRITSANGNSLLIDNQKPWLVVNVRGGDNLNKDTGISAATWHCFIGGLEVLGGDIDEDSGDTTDNLISAFTYINGSNWHVRGDFRSHNANESLWSLIVVCANKTLVAALPPVQ